MVHNTNFCFPVRVLENDRLRLVPFDPAIHAELFISGTVNHPSLYDYLTFGPYTSTESFLEEFYFGRVQPSKAMTPFAIYDKTKPSTLNEPDGDAKFAGMIGYLNASENDLKAEIGFIIILPEFQRTHVTSNAIGLLLFYALDLPLETPLADRKTYEGAVPLIGGLGLRRVQWQANAMNSASVGAAQRMGYKMEGTLRWERTVRPTASSDITFRSRARDPRADLKGRHSAMLSICWDDWEGLTEDGESDDTKEPVRDKITKVMARRS